MNTESVIFFIIHRLMRTDTYGLCGLIGSPGASAGLRCVKYLAHSRHSVSGNYNYCYCHCCCCIVSPPLSDPLSPLHNIPTPFCPRFCSQWVSSPHLSAPISPSIFLSCCYSGKLSSPAGPWDLILCLHWVCLAPWKSESS